MKIQLPGAAEVSTGNFPLGNATLQTTARETTFIDTGEEEDLLAMRH